MTRKRAIARQIISLLALFYSDVISVQFPCPKWNPISVIVHYFCSGQTQCIIKRNRVQFVMHPVSRPLASHLISILLYSLPLTYSPRQLFSLYKQPPSILLVTDPSALCAVIKLLQQAKENPSITRLPTTVNIFMKRYRVREDRRVICCKAECFTTL